MKTELDTIRDRNRELENEVRFLRQRQAQYESTPRCAELTKRADELMYRKEVDWAFIQQRESIDSKKVRNETGNEKGIHGLDRATDFRVWVRTTSGAFADRTMPTLEAAIAEVLEAVGLR